MSDMRKLWIALAVAGSGLLSSRPAAAQYTIDKDYRRSDRLPPESPQRFALELRLGPYVPRIDDEFSNGQRPFHDTFGDGKGFYIGAEFDWQALRIPYLGTLGPGFSFGYTSRSGKAKLSGTTEDSAQETSLLILPMYAVGVLRVDVLARHLSIPIVPYGKAGLGFGLWSASSGEGVSNRDGVAGRGRAWGTHFALGAMLQLDFLEPDVALAFDEESGVNNSYLYAEWLWSDLGGLALESKPQMRIGTSGWVAGLALEF